MFDRKIADIREKLDARTDLAVKVAKSAIAVTTVDVSPLSEFDLLSEEDVVN